jgi:two-component system, NarL family, nitrate/nitrite response regulator NarL
MDGPAPAPIPARPLEVAVLVRNEVLRQGLEVVLRSLPGVGRVVRCADGEDPAGHDVDLVVTSAGDGIPPAGTRTLVLVDDAVIGDPARVAELRADGFLAAQDLSARTLGDALSRCAAGEMPMPAALARALLARAGEPRAGRARPATLTPREVETLELLVRGLSNKQIGRRLGVSDHGAKRLVGSILLKLDSPNRTAAVVSAIQAGLVDPGPTAPEPP